MIKEIPNPLETIQEFLAKRLASKRIRKKFKTNLTELDVYFEQDVELIKEFSERADISYEEAERIAMAFFEEIKRQLIDCNIINIENFGKFYLDGPHIDEHGKYVFPSEKRTRVRPSFRAHLQFKKDIKKFHEQKGNNKE